MRKIIVVLLTLAIAVPCVAAKKNNDEAKKRLDKALPLVLASSSDTMSYAAGIMQTKGLTDYLERTHGIKADGLKQFAMGLLEYYMSQNDTEKKAYYTGMVIGDQIQTQMLEPMKKEFSGTPDSIVDNMLMRGFIDAILGNNILFATPDEAGEKFQEMYTVNKEARDNALYGENIKKGQEFLAQNALKDSVVALPSGLQYKVLVEGDGARPHATDKVTVHYEGTLIDGTVFDASRNHGTEPISFRLNEVIKGWTEALTMMKVGSKWQVFIPYELAYGNRQAGQIPPFSTLIFTIELLGVEI